MRRRWGLLLLLLLLAFAGRAATSGQSFLYVASPSSSCVPDTADPCPPSQVLVYDTQTLGLVTRIPLPGSAAGTSESRIS